MSNPSLAGHEAVNASVKLGSALPDYDDDDEAEGDEDDDDESLSASRDRLVSLSDFGSPGWWFRT
jgi:hypothetical protein